MVVSQSVVATKFKIVNLVTGYIETDPVWTGNSRGWVGVLYGEANGKEYDSVHHHLKSIYLKIAGRGCLVADFEKDGVLGGVLDRARRSVIIRLYENEYSIDLGSGELMVKYGYQPGNC